MFGFNNTTPDNLVLDYAGVTDLGCRREINEDSLGYFPPADPSGTHLLVIVDILLPGDNGVRGTEQISAILPLVPIVILTMYEDVEYRDQAFRAGATLFIPKRKMFKELIPSLQAQLALAKP